MYGFEGEVNSKYSTLTMQLFSEVFNWLPLAHCIEGKILVRRERIKGVWWGDLGRARKDELFAPLR